MKLFKSKAEDSATADLEEAKENEAEADIDEGEGEKPESVIMAEKRIKTMLRCLGGLILSGALLFLSGLSILDLMEGPKETDAIQDEETGSFVMRDIFAVVGTYGEAERNYKKSIVPMGSQFVTVEFTGRYYESAKTIAEQTGEYMDGLLTALDLYVVAQGTVEELSEEQYAELELWFSENKDALVEKGMISDVDDASVYLSNRVLTVDTVNGKSQNMVIIMTALAVLGLAYVLAELLILVISGIRSKAAGHLNSGRKEEAAQDGEPPAEENKKPEDSNEL